MSAWWCPTCKKPPSITLDIYPPLCGECRTRCVKDSGAQWMSRERDKLRTALAASDTETVEGCIESFCHEGFYWSPGSNEAGICSETVTTEGKTREQVVDEVGRICLAKYDDGQEGC